MNKIIHNFTYHKKTKSFGLVEVLLSSLIFVILIGGIATLSQRSISMATRTTERQFALGWAQEGIEAVLQTGISGLSYQSNDVWMGYPQYNNGTGIWSLQNTPNLHFTSLDPFVCDSTGLFNIENIDWHCVAEYEYKEPFDNDDPSLSAIKKKIRFSRIISIKKTIEGGYEKYLIRSKIVWDTNANPSDPKNFVELSTIITN